MRITLDTQSGMETNAVLVLFAEIMGRAGAHSRDDRSHQIKLQSVRSLISMRNLRQDALGDGQVHNFPTSGREALRQNATMA
jgi:hypothetical protein